MRTKTTALTSIYHPHPSITMIQNWIAKLPEKTGRSLEQWLRFIERHGPAGEAARRDWLKEEHGLGTNESWWLAVRSYGKGTEDGDPQLYLQAAAGYVEAMYSGAKAGLRPIHDALIALARSLGPEIRICPCKTMVPIYRRYAIAQIKPTTRTRIDFGLALKGAPGRLPARLIPTGGLEKKDRITHRVPISSVDEIDEGVERWLRAAYELDA